MRTQYSCKCDTCGKVIEDLNDKNDVSLNETKLVMCPFCFIGLEYFIEYERRILMKKPNES